MFVERNAQNKVIGLYASRQEGYATEELPDDHPEVLAFNAKAGDVDRKVMLRRVKDAREIILNRLCGIGLANLSNTATLSAIQTTRLALLDMTKDPRIINATTAQALQTAAMQIWLEISAPVNAEIKSAFKEISL